MLLRISNWIHCEHTRGARINIQKKKEKSHLV